MSSQGVMPPLRGKTAFLPVPEPDHISLETLAALYLDGMRRVVAEPVAGGAGDSRDSGLLADRINTLNALLSSRGLARVVLKYADGEELAAWQREISGDEVENAGRRKLFARLAEPVAKAVEMDEPAAPPLARLQRQEVSRPGALFAHVPVIDASLCTGCDACLNGCPADALITLKDKDGVLCYHSRSQDCTGCDLCVDLCEHDAIRIEDMAERVTDLALDSFTCRACGTPVHEPRGRAAGNGLCRICRQTDHRRKLFQVLP